MIKTLKSKVSFVCFWRNAQKASNWPVPVRWLEIWMSVCSSRLFEDSTTFHNFLRDEKRQLSVYFKNSVPHFLLKLGANQQEKKYQGVKNFTLVACMQNSSSILRPTHDESSVFWRCALPAMSKTPQNMSERSNSLLYPTSLLTSC